MKSGNADNREHARGFLVIVHDVAPPYRMAVAEIFGRLAPLVGRNAGAAVIPKFRGLSWGRNDRGFAERVGAGAGELFLHGLTHCRESGCGLVTLLTHGSDEFSSLSRRQATERLRQGETIVTETFGRSPCGFIPPAWRSGPATAQRVFEAGLDIHVGFQTLRGSDGRSRLLATYTWDWGRIASLGHLGGLFGRIAAARREAIPCIAFHPADVERGHLSRGIEVVQRLLATGRRPMLANEILGLNREDAAHEPDSQDAHGLAYEPASDDAGEAAGAALG